MMQISDKKECWDTFNFEGRLATLTLPQISFKAKALFLLINSFPEIFKDPACDKKQFLLDISKEKWDAINSGIKELVECGLLEKVTHRKEGPGRNYITGTSWHIITSALDEFYQENNPGEVE